MGSDTIEVAKLLLSGNYHIQLIEYDDSGDFFRRFVEERNITIKLSDNENILNKFINLFPPETSGAEIDEYCYKILIRLIPVNDDSKPIDNILLYDSTILDVLRKFHKNVNVAKPSFFINNEYKFKYFSFSECYSGKYRGYIYLDTLKEYAEELELEFNDKTNIDDLSKIFRYTVFERYEWNYYEDLVLDNDDVDIYYILDD